MKHSLLLSAALLTSTSLFSADKYYVKQSKPLDVKIEEKVPFSLTLKNSNGSSSVFESKDDKIVIQAKSNTDAYEVQIVVSGLGSEEVDIDVLNAMGPPSNPPPSEGTTIVVNGEEIKTSTAFAIWVPEKLMKDIRIEQMAGAVIINGVFKGSQEKRKVNALANAGKIDCTDVTALGGITLHSDAGTVSLTNTIGNSLLEARAGSVTATGNQGNIDAKVEAGSIHITDQVGDYVNAHTHFGKITLNNPKVKKETASADFGYVSTTPPPPKPSKR